MDCKEDDLVVPQAEEITQTQTRKDNFALPCLFQAPFIIFQHRFCTTTAIHENVIAVRPTFSAIICCSGKQLLILRRIPEASRVGAWCLKRCRKSVCDYIRFALC